MASLRGGSSHEKTHIGSSVAVSLMAAKFFENCAFDVTIEISYALPAPVQWCNKLFNSAIRLRWPEHCKQARRNEKR
ncbi:hypothetical protein Taro_017454 [Colocasia esculenta]|uniref:Uncharacterized protein n=1 Tax=Colocasia esculenta TaxID=4460 RepID=A0A843UNN3_COLES|nr:hypothetical protein [Colocasia esculenta]